MPAIQKTVTATITASDNPEDPPGTFIALVSVFGNVDSYGDIMQAGAFAKTLEEWVAKGRPIPVVWAHQMSDPDNILGEFVEAAETLEGLLMKGLMDLDHPKAARVHKLLAKGLIAEFSFSGEVRSYSLIEPEDEDDDWWPGLLITEVDLWEAGPCFKGANPDTQLLSVKSADLTGPLARRIRATKAIEAPKDPGDEATVLAENDAEDVSDSSGDESTNVDVDTTILVERSAASTPSVRALLELSTITS